MAVLRMGVIGVGNMGTSHIRWILDGDVPGMELVAVADQKQSRLDHVRALPGCEGIACFAEGTELIDSGTADAVLIATPHYDHPPLAIRAFERGLHVLCEKPAGVYTKAVREMNQAAARSGKRFGMMFNQRTNALYRKMREIIVSGELGEIKRTNWLVTDWYRSQSYYDSGAWRATWAGEGGGVLLNQCPHNLDLWQWICGMPVSIRAFCREGAWHDIEVEDDVTCYATYANGATGVFITSTGDTPGTDRFEVLMDKGKLVAENGVLTMTKLAMGEKEFSATYTGGFGEPERTVSVVETDGQNLQHVGVLRAFVDAALNGGPLVAPGEEGLFGLTLSNAMHLSSWLDKTVTLPLDEDLFLRLLKERAATSRHKTSDNDVVLNTEGSYHASARI
ncbi:MAG: Gfo/Idh/MocA family oxidoreductase [Clostridia bacterium]|nr:Gfo/Idh/MocA family oxidoreductase [Clostridia bacterium]